MSECDKQTVSRNIKFSEELWEAVGQFARARPPMTRTQAVKYLIATGIHHHEFDPRRYLSTSSLEED